MNARILSHPPDAEFFIDEQCYINELSHSGSDPSLSIAKARVKPGVSTRWHALKDTVERYVILAGTGRVEVGDLPAQDLGPHDVVIIPAGCRQRISNTGAEDLVFLALCSPRFDVACYEELGALLREETAEVERGDGDTKTRNMLHEGVPVQLLPD